MTDQDLCEVICIIDRSGSMESIRSDAIGGFNSFLRTQREFPGRAKLTLALFNHSYLLVHDGLDIREVPDLDEKTFKPEGNTALLDAIGRTIDEVSGRLEKTADEEKPGKVIVVILTDGMENASSDYTRDRVFEIIKRKREQDGWEFVFLAANQDAFETAASLAIPKGTTSGFIPTAKGTQEGLKHTSQVVLNLRKDKKKLN